MEMTGNLPLAAQKSQSVDREQTWAFGVVTGLFFIFGFITCLNDILVPHLKALFDLQYSRAALVQFCFFAAYFLMSLPASAILRRLGYQVGTVIGLVTTAVGCALFYPAAEMQSYVLFLLGLFTLASGITLIQVAANPYVSILGPPQTSSARLTLAQAFNSLGTTLAPLLGAAFILSQSVRPSTELATLSAPDLQIYRATQAATVQGPYIGLAVVLVLLAIIVWKTKLPNLLAEGHGSGESIFHLQGAWRSPRLLMGAIGIFAYVGAEVAIGSYLINFLASPDILGISDQHAGRWVAVYWGGAMVGRFIGAAVLKKVSPSKVLTFNAVVAGALVLTALCTYGAMAAIAILFVGLFNSIMFPTIFTLAIEDLGEHTAQGSGILCMAIVGGAVIPLLQGFMADAMGLHHSMWIPIVCYVYIGYYALRAVHLKSLVSKTDDAATATALQTH